MFPCRPVAGLSVSRTGYSTVWAPGESFVSTANTLAGSFFVNRKLIR